MTSTAQSTAVSSSCRTTIPDHSLVSFEVFTVRLWGCSLLYCRDFDRRKVSNELGASERLGDLGLDELRRWRDAMPELVAAQVDRSDLQSH